MKSSEIAMIILTTGIGAAKVIREIAWWHIENKKLEIKNRKKKVK